jgi:hypothetical protein
MARLRFLIEQVEKQVIKLEHLEGTTHPSDVLSKSTPRPAHDDNCSAFRLTYRHVFSSAWM